MAAAVHVVMAREPLLVPVLAVSVFCPPVLMPSD
jgi:hypothetical protein